jgi:hypothetical protein
MSDPVLIAIIVGIPSCLSAVTSLFNAFNISKSNRHVLETKDAMVNLEKQTNSMKDELIRVTAVSEFAKGLKKGQEDNK